MKKRRVRSSGARRGRIDRQKLAAYARRIGKSKSTARKWAVEGPPRTLAAKWKKSGGPPKSVLAVSVKSKPVKVKMKAAPKKRAAGAASRSAREKAAEKRAEKAERALATEKVRGEVAAIKARAEATEAHAARIRAEAARERAEKRAHKRAAKESAQKKLEKDKWRKAELLLRHAVQNGTLYYEWAVIADVLGLSPQEVFERGYQIGGATAVGARKLWYRYEQAEVLVQRALANGTFETEYLRIAALTGMSAREVYTLGVSPPSLGVAA